MQSFQLNACLMIGNLYRFFFILSLPLPLAFNVLHHFMGQVSLSCKMLIFNLNWLVLIKKKYWLKKEKSPR